MRCHTLRSKQRDSFWLTRGNMRIFPKNAAPLLFVLALTFLAGCASTSSTPSSEKMGDIYLQNGTESLMSGKYAEALSALSRAVQLLPESEQAWNNLGLAYGARKDFKRAEESWLKAIQINPRFSDARNNLGALYLSQNNFKKAEQELKKVTDDAVYANLFQTHYNLGLLYLQTHKTIQAEQQLALSVQNNESYCPAWFRLGILQKQRGSLPQATESLRKSVTGQCFQNPEAHFELANTYLKLNNLPMAKAKYLEVIQFFPNTDFARESEMNLSLLR